MKFLARIVLLLFIVFLSTPTIVSVIKKNTDTSYFFNASEEEQSLKEVKVELKIEPALSISFLPTQTSIQIPSGNSLKHDNITASIFIPPPEQV